jgi:hypothetical protein
MAEEWRIIFEQGSGGAPSSGNMAAPAAGATGAGPNPVVTPPPQNTSGGGGASAGASSSGGGMAPVIDFFKQILPFAGPLVFVIQAIRRSKIFSTFMDTFLTVASAMIDILLIPLVPLLGPALKFMLSFLPYLKDISKFIGDFIKDPW